MVETARDTDIRKQIGAAKQAHDDAIWNEAIEAAAKELAGWWESEHIAEDIRKLKREPKP